MTVIYLLTVYRLEVKYQDIGKLVPLEAVREGFVLGFSHWLMDGSLLDVSLYHLSSVCVYVHIVFSY